MAPIPVERGSERTRCNACGSYVTHDFIRVFGDNDGEIAACPACSTMRDLSRGGSVPE